MTNIIRWPYLSVTVAGGTLTDVLAARVQTGYDMRVAQAEVVARSLPAAAVPWGTVEITMGANPATAQKRFSGYFMGAEQQLFEHTVTLVCKGKLQRAETYEAMTDVDMTSKFANQNAGLSTWGHTDEVMVQTILYICGLASQTDPADPQIEGTGRLLGSQHISGYEWQKGESALSFIEK